MFVYISYIPRLRAGDFGEIYFLFSYVQTVKLKILDEQATGDKGVQLQSTHDFQGSNVRVVWYK